MLTMCSLLSFCCIYIASESERPIASANQIVFSNAVVVLKTSANLPAQESGVVKRILIAPGQRVLSGQRLVELDEERFEIELRVSKLQAAVSKLTSEDVTSLRFAKLNRLYAEKSLSRILAAKDAVAKSEVDQIEVESKRSELVEKKYQLELQVSKVQSQLAETQHLLSRHRLNQRKIEAPFDGEVAEVQVEENEWVNTGDTVVRIIDLNQLRVKALVSAEQFDENLLGANVEFKVGNRDGNSYVGNISFVSSEIDHSSQCIEIWADIENHDRQLRPGTVGSLAVQSKTVAKDDGLRKTLATR